MGRVLGTVAIRRRRASSSWTSSLLIPCPQGALFLPHTTQSHPLSHPLSFSHPLSPPPSHILLGWAYILIILDFLLAEGLLSVFPPPPSFMCALSALCVGLPHLPGGHSGLPRPLGMPRPNPALAQRQWLGLPLPTRPTGAASSVQSKSAKRPRAGNLQPGRDRSVCSQALAVSV